MTVESILAWLGVAYLVMSALATVLPTGSKAQAFFAKFALALKGAEPPKKEEKK